MTDKPIPHPAQALGAAAIETMDRIGIGQIVRTGGPKSAVAKLLKAGLIVPVGERVICKDRFGTVSAWPTKSRRPIIMRGLNIGSNSQNHKRLPPVFHVKPSP